MDRFLRPAARRSTRQREQREALLFNPRQFERSAYDLNQIAPRRVNTAFATAFKVRQEQNASAPRLPNMPLSDERRLLESTMERVKRWNQERHTRVRTPTISFTKEQATQLGLLRVFDIIWNSFDRLSNPNSNIVVKLEWERARPQRYRGGRFDHRVARVQRVENPWGISYVKRFTLTNLNFENTIRRLYEEVVYDTWESDPQEVLRNIENQNWTRITFEKVKVKPRSGNLRTGFFPWTLRIPLDMSRHQVFQDVSAGNYTDQCFVYALKQALTDDNGTIEPAHLDTISRAKMYVKNRVISQQNLKPISQFSKLSFKVSKPGATRMQDTTYEPSDFSTREVHIGVLDKHAFLFEPVPITMYALKNYVSLEEAHNGNLDEFRYQVRADESKDQTRVASSFTVLKYMLDFEACHATIVKEINQHTSTFEEVMTDKLKQELRENVLEHFISDSDLDSFAKTVLKNRHFHYLQKITSSVSVPQQLYEFEPF